MIDISICVGSSCHLKGSYPIISEFKRLIAENSAEEKINLKASFCTGDCVNGVCVEIDGEKIRNVTPKAVEALFTEKVIPKIG